MFDSENEKEFFNKLYVVKNQNELNKIFNDFNIIFEPLFNVGKLKKSNFTIYEIILKKKKHNYFKFDDDEKLYNAPQFALMQDKKELLNNYQHFTPYLKNIIGCCIFDHINKKYILKISNCDYYNFKRWFISLFIYYIHFLNNKTSKETINIKCFRAWIKEYNEKYITNIDKLKNILNDLNELTDLEDEIKQNIKTYFNLILPNYINNIDIKLI